ncbi:NUDIX domain-containing protein [Kordiimonas pumila]|uniref:NUDIX domain-containing protein n=1 Tax=Kordiimonas pumila TaxID=2161677 RepID=A0ABV7D9H3_9PROT|nr:NUDIX hydrolase [Kordiimonas pumila]
MYWRQVKSTKKALKNMPVSVKAVVVSRDGKALVMRKYYGTVDLPGGRLEKGEDMYSCLQREVFEETGLTVKKFEFVCSWVKHSPDTGDRLMVVFETQLRSKAKNTTITLSDEHVWHQFMISDEAEELADMPPGYATALEVCFSRYRPI